MNITTLNMTTLDGGVIIKKGEGGGSTPPSGGESAEEWGYFLLNWGEQTSNIVTMFSSVVRVSEYSIWSSLSSIGNPATISKIDGCAINLSMKIRNDEIGISSLTSIKEYFISALGENYNELLGQMGFTPITKEQFYSLE